MAEDTRGNAGRRTGVEADFGCRGDMGHVSLPVVLSRIAQAWSPNFAFQDA